MPSLVEIRAEAIREARTALMADERLHAHSAHERSATAGLGLSAWCLGCRWAEALETYATRVEGITSGPVPRWAVPGRAPKAHDLAEWAARLAEGRREDDGG